MKSTIIAILSATLASACCVIPLVLSFLGLGSLGLGAVAGEYRGLFLAAALVMMFLSWKKYFASQGECGKNCQRTNLSVAFVIQLTVTVIVLLFVVLNLYTYSRSPLDERLVKPETEGETIVIPINGLTCFSCEVALSTVLEKTEGVIRVNTSAKEGKALIIYDPAKTGIGRLVEVINKAGYKARAPESRPGDQK